MMAGLTINSRYCKREHAHAGRATTIQTRKKYLIIKKKKYFTIIKYLLIIPVHNSGVIKTDISVNCSI